MADYTDSKSGLGSQFPKHAVDAHSFGRLEPLVTPEQLKSRYLFGIPLYSNLVDPITKKKPELTTERLKDIINGAVSKCEADLKMDIFPVQRKERSEFDSGYFRQFMLTKTKYSPIASVDRMAIETASLQEIYIVPKEWIEVGGFIHGNIHVIPLAVATPALGGIPVGGLGGQLFLSILGQASWIPYYWSVTYTTGFLDGKIPRIINDLIAITAAIDVLGMLGATNTNNSASLGIDGLSEAVSTPGPQLFQPRIQELQQKKAEIVGKVQVMFGRKMFVMDF